MRVGILACNCYQWIIYDLALLELRAQSVAFTDDLAGMSADELLDKVFALTAADSGVGARHTRSADTAAMALLMLKIMA